ncbi:cupin domain-containing protein [Sneathiella sp. P13V-1]|uniref:cupin domain-containing protein n=1 Tax=Sneathiella sp. P13V-1 TaxID=2697366 RepID=UPI00187B2F42|nr:cupin domain-containing protein [Sneathiella sp. P13V-1]MBE7637820.1 cupin domain-containing protein [Sneathiella sp. P13V-1]
MSVDKYLVTAKQISEFEGVKKVHFLNDKAIRVNKSLGDLTGLTGFGFHIVEVQPGDETTEHHVHYHEDECVYVLEGTATAYVGEENFEIGPGDFIGYRKGGLSHSLKNTGDVLFRCIVVGERNEHDIADYTRLKKRIFRQKSVGWNLVDQDDIEEIGGNVGKK